jgi:hypothetical protein
LNVLLALWMCTKAISVGSSVGRRDDVARETMDPYRQKEVRRALAVRGPNPSLPTLSS